MLASFIIATLCAYESGDAIRNLSNPTVETRDRALIDVELRRDRLENELLEQLKEVLEKPDDALNGRTHTVLQAIATLRADNTVPELIEAVDFTLDPKTFPVGGRRTTSSYYPVAETLSTIGNRRVITEIVSAATQPREDKILRIYAWILIEILGKDAAKVVVERGKLSRVPVAQQGILRLLKMLDERPLLEMPHAR